MFFVDGFQFDHISFYFDILNLLPTQTHDQKSRVKILFKVGRHSVQKIFSILEYFQITQNWQVGVCKCIISLTNKKFDIYLIE